MTNEERKVIELALEALETPWNAPYVDGCDLALGKRVKAITAIKETLAQPEDKKCENCGEFGECCQDAQPEQEPVAYLSNKRQRLNIELKPQIFVNIPTITDWEMPLYIKPPQHTWVGLTDEELKDIWVDYDTNMDALKTVEAKLKEKNT